MNRQVKTLLVVVGLVVAFSSGWLAAQIQSRNRVSINQLWANQWIGSVLLLARHGGGAELIKPEQVPLIVGDGLDGQSLVLGSMYDGLSPANQQLLIFYIPAARAIAISQQGPGTLQDRHHLLNLVDCMQKVQTEGGSVQKCVDANKK